jgi:1,4-dihydroxy-2-naphthoate octaprenyltransferase
MWKVWVLASRPHTLTASLSPGVVGYAIASSTIDYHSSVSLFLIFLRWFFFCVLIQLATNLHNDYADFIKGADTVERVGQARATQKGWLLSISNSWCLHRMLSDSPFHWHSPFTLG